MKKEEESNRFYKNKSFRNTSGALEKEDFTMKMQSGKIKVIKCSLMVLSGTRKANCVYTVDGQRSTQQYTKSGVVKHLGVSGIQQNGLVEETNATLLAKWVIKLWRLDDVTSKVVHYRTMGFNEIKEYNKTFIEIGVGTGSMQVLQGVEFEVEPQEDHTFEVEPPGNVDHVAGSQEEQTQDLIYYHLARDREQHSTHELFSYREDSNEAAFAVAEAKKIYAHESLTFNNIVACEVISKWKVGLKDSIDARSDVYVLSNGCRKCCDDNDVYYWEYTPRKLCMKIVKDQSGNTLRVSQSRFYNEKLVQTLLEGHSILSLEGSLSGDCDVKKNDVGMLDNFDRGLQTDVQVFVDFDYAMGRSIIVMGSSITSGIHDTYGGCIGGYLAKGLAIESGFELKIVAGIATGALSKAIPGLRFHYRLNLLSIGKG
uniref:Zinc finger, CCHC-type n=1 Tax=Tanacetum cinerariifolium TaxID=118510 RepID=A0A6L2J8C4_TANCI|nr:zinc finger, CCHC-type [Tanacetum cinerariifolium]